VCCIYHRPHDPDGDSSDDSSGSSGDEDDGDDDARPERGHDHRGHDHRGEHDGCDGDHGEHSGEDAARRSRAERPRRRPSPNAYERVPRYRKRMDAGDDAAGTAAAVDGGAARPA
jgi:protein phosphatase 1 regulatory subunit 11